jgi:hypothetical protein
LVLTLLNPKHKQLGVASVAFLGAKRPHKWREAGGGILKPNWSTRSDSVQKWRDNEMWGNKACRDPQRLRYLHRTRFSSPARNPQHYFITVPFVISIIFVCLFSFTSFDLVALVATLTQNAEPHHS